MAEDDKDVNVTYIIIGIILLLSSLSVAGSWKKWIRMPMGPMIGSGTSVLSGIVGTILLSSAF
jgi:hypothetical protein